MLGLTEEIELLPDGMDTLLSYSGLPLRPEQALRLKLACALLGGTRVLVLTQLFDCLGTDLMQRFITAFTARGGSVLYFTQRNDIAVSTHRLRLGLDVQRVEVV